MNKSRFILYVTMIIPWFTAPFLGRKTFKRYLPATIFISLYLLVEGAIAKRYKWWWFYERLHPKLPGETPLILGPFFVGTLWILKYTYGKFFRFIFVNLCMNFLFVYGGIKALNRLGIVTLYRLNNIQMNLIFFIKSLTLYLFQYVYERMIKA